MKKWDIKSVLFPRWHIYVTNLLWTLHVWTPNLLWDTSQTLTVKELACLYTCTHTYKHTPSYLAWGTSMLEETTLRFCSSRDTDRVSGSRPARLSATRCSSKASGLREPPSTLWLSGAPLLELCWRGMQRRTSQCLGREPCTQVSNNADIGMSNVDAEKQVQKTSLLSRVINMSYISAAYK